MGKHRASLLTGGLSGPRVLCIWGAKPRLAMSGGAAGGVWREIWLCQVGEPAPPRCLFKPSISRTAVETALPHVAWRALVLVLLVKQGVLFSRVMHSSRRTSPAEYPRLPPSLLIGSRRPCL